MDESQQFELKKTQDTSLPIPNVVHITGHDYKRKGATDGIDIDISNTVILLHTSEEIYQIEKEIIAELNPTKGLRNLEEIFTKREVVKSLRNILQLYFRIFLSLLKLRGTILDDLITGDGEMTFKFKSQFDLNEFMIAISKDEEDKQRQLFQSIFLKYIETGQIEIKNPKDMLVLLSLCLKIPKGYYFYSSVPEDFNKLLLYLSVYNLIVEHIIFAEPKPRPRRNIPSNLQDRIIFANKVITGESTLIINTPGGYDSIYNLIRLQNWDVMWKEKALKLNFKSEANPISLDDLLSNYIEDNEEM
jgi:hypothetical protein